MFTVRKLFKFEAAHQLQSAYSECCTGTIHGHSYLVEVFFRAGNLNKDGMVIDFGKVNDVIKPMIEKWDHSLFLSAAKLEVHQLDFRASQKKLIVTPYNPTAENMAYHLFKTITETLLLDPFDEEGYEDPGQPFLWKVRVHETTTGWAEYQEDV